MRSRGKILIVDDEPINLEFFDVMLSKLGFTVEKAVNGEEALAKIRAVSPDLVLLDNIMPKLTGWEVTRTLKHDREYRKWRDTPIIMFTAMTDVKDRIDGLEMGVDDYITKPFNFSEVLARIRAVLRSRELTRQLLRREKRIGVVESLNSSLVFFTRHVRTPITELLEMADGAKANDPKAMRAVLERIRTEGRGILATLDGLEDEVEELQSRREQLRRGDLSIADLEEKLQKHLRNWRRRQNRGEEAGK